MTVPEGVDARWWKSSYSGEGQDCVEVRTAVDAVDVRDTKDRQGGQLALSAATWQAAIDRLRQA
jgi:hypothetical protein